MENIFNKGGYLEKILPGFEVRRGQEEMSLSVAEALFDSKNRLIEAGTGTGKTLAYLIPAVYYCLETGKKISVTTETRALQKQLIDKDMPVVKKLFNEHFARDFKYSLCLGSSNYVCDKRLRAAVSRGKFSGKNLKTAQEILSLVNSGALFSRFDVDIKNQLWSEIHRDPDACPGFRCPYAPQCVYQKIKKQWAESDILVMNHYLFFTNIASGASYLPRTDSVIFDEAHSVEEIAAAQLGFSISYDSLVEIMSSFHHAKIKNTLISRIEDPKLRRECGDTAKKIIAEASIFFERCRSLFGKEDFTLRIHRPPGFGALLVETCAEFLSLMKKAEPFFTGEEVKTEFEIARSSLAAFRDCLFYFTETENRDWVYWFERRDTDIFGDIQCRGEPVDISEIMNREVYPRFDSAIFTSATLTVAGSFAFSASRLGLSAADSLLLESPFDFKKQALLYLPQGSDGPENSMYAAHAAETAAGVISITGGRCLLLFTSYKMLGQVKSVLENICPFPLFSQSEYEPHEAMKLYMECANGVLLGTHSFWQGIDLPGDLLRAVIMMRLPFAVPNTPRVEARSEMLKNSGRNPFTEYQLPDSIIRFKQGFGRLIRSGTDRGIMALIDPRVKTKSYGPNFLKSIPACAAAATAADLRRRYAELFSNAGS